RCLRFGGRLFIALRGVVCWVFVLLGCPRADDWSHLGNARRAVRVTHGPLGVCSRTDTRDPNWPADAANRHRRRRCRGGAHRARAGAATRSWLAHRPGRPGDPEPGVRMGPASAALHPDPTGAVVALA